LTSTDTVTAGSDRYYRVRTLDSGGNESSDSARVEVTGDGSLLNVIFPADNEKNRVSLPTVLARQLLSENNGLGDDLVMAGTRVVSEETNGVVRSVRFDMRRADVGTAVPSFHFQPPQAGVILDYDVVNGQVMEGSTPLISASDSRNQLALYWFNGVEWIKVGGVVDDVNRTVRLTTGRMGRYQIRLSPRNHSGELVRVSPRAFTPNGDGWNDKVIFQLDNRDTLPVEGKVYDIHGTWVGSLSPGPAENTLAWDGRRGGKAVPGGVYFYRIKIGSQTKTGTVVVTR
jgi:gliding motility-associated-like protein